ncbi:Helix-turn-helix domain protein [Pelotomaculum sp. FP]|uniref:helix-turn-helix domain-containing protein n=1 Tax=Pelotomaculum sp. FP TaxID=261474 RepID=UPI001065D0F0|nr:RodZ domain-containing protein [Pelotomaculum sp. FP]TEB16616.1 Helix-turn-helix domain protein [Pelotomaculum sp. FP]
MEIGNSLKEAREARKLSLEEVEEETKIRRKYLQALENEQYEVLPGQVYAKAFLKNYARFLNLNVEEVMAAFNHSPAEEAPQPQDSNNISRTEPELKRGQKPRYWLYLATVVMVMGLTVSVYYTVRSIGFNHPARGEFKTEEQNQAPPNPSVGQQPPTEEPINKQEGVRLTFSVTKNTCWMRVIVDGAPAFQGEVPAGQTQEFTGTEKISFRLGNAGVVQVQLNGQDLGFLGEEGAVIDREFTSSPTG